MGANPSKPDPSRKVEVIGAGFSRTGTLSMSLAFENIYHGPSYHGGCFWMWGSDSYVRKWVEAAQAKKAGNRELMMKKLKEATTGFVGFTDVPITMFVPELIDLYPQAKVVLVLRDPEKWWKSIAEVIDYTLMPWVRYLTFIVPGLRWFVPMYDLWWQAHNELLGDQTLRPSQWGPGRSFLNIVAVYELTNRLTGLILKYNDMIREVVPKDRLLEMELKDGWEPLCKFLGQPIPDEPFPHADDASISASVAAKVFAKVMLVWTGVLGTAGASIYMGWRMRPQ